MKVGALLLLVGAVGLAWTGSTLAGALHLSREVELNLAGFALAILLMVGAALRVLAARVRALEAALKAPGMLPPDHAG
jgi:hypothetical protein